MEMLMKITVVYMSELEPQGCVDSTLGQHAGHAKLAGWVQARAHTCAWHAVWEPGASPDVGITKYPQVPSNQKIAWLECCVCVYRCLPPLLTSPQAI